jgi:hypothetical protein
LKKTRYTIYAITAIDKIAPNADAKIISMSGCPFKAEVF